MNFLSQLKLARMVSAGQLDRAMAFCESHNPLDVDPADADPDLLCVTMLCLWWRGDHNRAFSLAQSILAIHSNSPRSAIEIAGSYYAPRPELPGAVDAVQRLAQLNPVAGSRLILSNPSWFARSVSANNNQQLLIRVQRAVDNFTNSRREHVCWAKAWLDADPIDRAQISPPSI